MNKAEVHLREFLGGLACDQLEEGLTDLTDCRAAVPEEVAHHLNVLHRIHGDLLDGDVNF
ncbi:MAG: hypothetical protein J7598_24475 [Mitsuaria chitosanitabida]|uniref:hypothetical protein n=1 Tax=Roseateles chitosanitabidus TaxID=65048 RepID=UPI001B20C628|nr:hypothetical protein [Roseateles chitosanitabidus]MBO9689769.1 hypothetical protein [Roseateles chitosanitabidus]